VISITDGLGVFCYNTYGVSWGLIDLACAFAAVGNRPAPFEDVESGPVLVYRAPKMGQHAAKRMRSCDGRRRSVLAKSAPNLRRQCRLLSWVTRMLGSTTADDLGRRCERRLNPPQMCQLISMSSGDMGMGFTSLLAKPSPRGKTLREHQVRFLVGRIGAEKGEGNIGPRKKPRGTRWMTVSRSATPCLPSRSV
jgi:hypothetical protein